MKIRAGLSRKRSRYNENVPRYACITRGDIASGSARTLLNEQ